MADRRISELPAATDVIAAALVEISQRGADGTGTNLRSLRANIAQLLNVSRPVRGRKIAQWTVPVTPYTGSYTPNGVVLSTELDAPSGFTSTGDWRLNLPDLPPNIETDGLWLVASNGGIEQSAVKLAWGPGALSRAAGATGSRSETILRWSRTALVSARYEFSQSIGAHMFLVGFGDTIPSNALVEVFLAR